MVRATLGVLITGDVALIEFIRWLDEQQPPTEKIIIGVDLDDTHLLIKDRFAKLVQDKVIEWQQSLRFEPRKEQG